LIDLWKIDIHCVLQKSSMLTFSRYRHCPPTATLKSMLSRSVFVMLVLQGLLLDEDCRGFFPAVAAAVPANDVCENAAPLGASTEIVLGSTLEATNDKINLCGENLINSPGVWYVYQGNEEPEEPQPQPQNKELIVEVSTCTQLTDFDTSITVFRGYCSSLNCVGGRNDDSECSFAGEHSTIAFTATPGERYYIHIHGYLSNHTGNFGVVLTETEPLDDSPSAAAVIISKSGFYRLIMLLAFGSVGATALL